MESSFAILIALQAINVTIYWWVGKAYISQPRWNHPSLFYNPRISLFLVAGPQAIWLLLVVLAFIFSNSPWLFLGLSIAGFVAFSTNAHPDHLS